MSEKLKHFLIVFDHAAGMLMEPVIEFGEDSDRAVEAYSAKEAELKDRQLVEVVLIGSDSLQTVRLTHANYFEPALPAISKYLAELVLGAVSTRRGKLAEPGPVVPFPGHLKISSKS